jgi:hypothetical protein
MRPGFVPSALTPLSLQEASIACLQAHSIVFGVVPGRDELCMMLAQWAEETARGRAMWNNNAGNLRGTGPGGLWTVIEGASEVVDGHEFFWRRGAWVDKAGTPAPADVAAKLGDNGFAAYSNATEGFAGLLRFVGVASHPPKPNRFAAAWGAAKRGDVAAYCAGLKAGHYFTADLGIYTRGMNGLFTWVRDSLFVEQARP